MYLSESDSLPKNRKSSPNFTSFYFNSISRIIIYAHVVVVKIALKEVVLTFERLILDKAEVASA